MRWIIVVLLFIGIKSENEMDKYSALRDECQHHPSNPECLQLKSQFFQLIKKCQIINTPQQFLICQQVKTKLCAIFPSYCLSTTTKTTKKQTKSKLKSTTKAKSITTTTKTKPTTTTTTMTTTKTTITSNTTMTNEEFVKVPVNPDELRSRGEYCVRHGKEKKCQQLLDNLKNTYSTCSKKKPSIKPEQIDCHSFQTHLCKAFPKFPPCLKKTS